MRSAPRTASNTRSATSRSSACMRAPSSASLAEGLVKNASLDDVKKALTAGGIGPGQVRQSLYRHRDPDRRQGRAVRHRLRRQRAADGGQARRQHEGGRPRSGGRLHGRDLAFPSRSHLRPVGEGDQCAGISECGNPDARGGVQVLDRSGAGGEDPGGRPRHM